ncbi:MAG: hypothetical protein K0M64_04345 [Rhizobium sp.]|nr:hypothetical protein [Rhizobium sp.]
MMTTGRRKAALYLSSVSPSERRALLARLPAATGRSLLPMVQELVRRRWNVRAAVEQVLSEDLRGLTATTTLDVESLLILARHLSPGWYARVIEASGPVDRQFLLALLDDDYAARVRRELQHGTPLAPALASALLAEAMALAGREASGCAR